MVFECTFVNCGETFDKQWKLDAHVCSHTGERPFICEEPGCEKSFIRKTHLQRHALSHSEERPHVCATCNTSFKVLSNLRKHERIHEGKKPYHCQECTAAFLKKNQLYSHLMTAHAQHTPFKCDVCDTSFTTQSHLSRHKQKHFRRFMCTECLEIFDKFSVLQKHINKEHKKRHVPICDYCNTTFSSVSSLHSHMRAVHRSPDSGVYSEGGSTQLSVELKTESMGSASVGSVDMWSNSGDKTPPSPSNNKTDVELDPDDTTPPLQPPLPPPPPTLTCPTCHKPFTGKSQLTLHRKTVHHIVELVEYKCTFANCTALFKHKHNYLKHIKSKHEGIKQFQCLQCPAQFFYKQSFERHVLALHKSNKTKRKPSPWNKLTLNEELSGHIVDARVKQYIDDMRHSNSGS